VALAFKYKVAPTQRGVLHPTVVITGIGLTTRVVDNGVEEQPLLVAIQV
jgi:hypothetical protein